jgi:hypothetical protein
MWYAGYIILIIKIYCMNDKKKKTLLYYKLGFTIDLPFLFLIFYCINPFFFIFNDNILATVFYAMEHKSTNSDFNIHKKIKKISSTKTEMNPVSVWH